MSEEEIPKPTKAQIAEALKKPTNYIKVEFGYGLKVVLPYADGIALMECLKNAEHYDYISDLSAFCIRPFKAAESPTSAVMSESDYIDKKMTALFNMKIETK